LGGKNVILQPRLWQTQGGKRCELRKSGGCPCRKGKIVAGQRRTGPKRTAAEKKRGGRYRKNKPISFVGAGGWKGEAVVAPKKRGGKGKVGKRGKEKQRVRRTPPPGARGMARTLQKRGEGAGKKGEAVGVVRVTGKKGWGKRGTTLPKGKGCLRGHQGTRTRESPGAKAVLAGIVLRWKSRVCIKGGREMCRGQAKRGR